MLTERKKGNSVSGSAADYLDVDNGNG